MNDLISKFNVFCMHNVSCQNKKKGVNVVVVYVLILYDDGSSDHEKVIHQLFIYLCCHFVLIHLIMNGLLVRSAFDLKCFCKDYMHLKIMHNGNKLTLTIHYVFKLIVCREMPTRTNCIHWVSIETLITCNRFLC